MLGSTICPDSNFGEGQEVEILGPYQNICGPQVCRPWRAAGLRVGRTGASHRDQRCWSVMFSFTQPASLRRNVNVVLPWPYGAKNDQLSDRHVLLARTPLVAPSRSRFRSVREIPRPVCRPQPRSRNADLTRRRGLIDGTCLVPGPGLSADGRDRLRSMSSPTS